jgi:hypothetical protein
MADRTNLESAAASYSYLKGLFSIPAGALLVLAGLTNLGWGPLGHAWIFLVAAVATAATYVPITHFYNERYGRVTPSRRQQLRVAAATALSAVAVGAGVQIDWSLDLPVNATAASFAVVMLVYYAVTSGLRTHHRIIWGGLLLAGLAPVWAGVGSDSKINVGLLLMGVTTIVAGVFDHLALVRRFGTPGGADAQNGNASA